MIKVYEVVKGFSQVKEGDTFIYDFNTDNYVMTREELDSGDGYTYTSKVEVYLDKEEVEGNPLYFKELYNDTTETKVEELVESKPESEMECSDHDLNINEDIKYPAIKHYTAIKERMDSIEKTIVELEKLSDSSDLSTTMIDSLREQYLALNWVIE